MPLSLSLATEETVDGVCLELLPAIKRGLSHGAGDRTTAEHFIEAVRRGDIKIMVIHDGDTIIAGTFFSVLQCPARKIVFIELVAGEKLDSWIELQSALDDYRALIGADAVEASCRFGLARRLERHGWRRKAVLMEMAQ